MKENAYRAYKAFILTVIAGGVLFLGSQYIDLYSQQVRTGRFTQFDMRKNYSTDGKYQSDGAKTFIDTQMGAVYAMSEGKLINVQTGEEFKP